MDTRASRCAIWKLHAPPSREADINPNPKKGGYPAPDRVTFLTGPNRDFPKWRRQTLFWLGRLSPSLASGTHSPSLQQPNRYRRPAPTKIKLNGPDRFRHALTRTTRPSSGARRGMRTSAAGIRISTTHPDPGRIEKRKPCNFTIAATRFKPRPRPDVCLTLSDR